MTDSTGSNRTRLLLLGPVAFLSAAFGWHYYCHAHLEQELGRGIGDSLRDRFEDAYVAVSIQPVSNLVLIEVDLPVQVSNEFANTIADIVVEYARLNLEPIVERELATAARASVDLYAMAIPYHVAIDVSNVRKGFSRLTRDIQKELLRLGYDLGAQDGINGPKTSKAIADVQAQLNMVQTGQGSRELLERIRAAKPKSQRSAVERTREP